MKDTCLFCFALRPFLTLHHTVGAEKPTHLGGLLSERPVNSRGGGSLCVLDKVPGFWSMRCLGVKDLALGHEDTSFCFPHNHVDILYLPLCIQSALCLKGSGWVQVWEHSGKRSEGRQSEVLFLSQCPPTRALHPLLKGRVPA